MMFRRKGAQAAVKSGKHALALAGESQQVRVGKLPVALQAGFHCLYRCRNLEAVRPEFMSRMRQILGQKRQRRHRLKTLPGESRIRHNPHEAQLRERAGGPAIPCTSAKPPLGGFVVLVGRPQQGGQNVEI